MNSYDYQRFILLVEDDEFIATIFKSVLSRHPEYLLDWSNTVENALSKIENIAYDIIFLDMKFGSDTYKGMEVLRSLNRIVTIARARGQKVIDSLVVIMSASIDFRDVMREAHDLGVLCFMDKPISFTEDFLESIFRRVGIPILPPPRQ